MSTAEQILNARDDAARQELRRIGAAIGYGNAQAILGQLWDEMLIASYGFGGRGAMGVTVDDALPPIPKPAAKRRQQRSHGGYEMVPAYSVSELKQFGHACIAKATGGSA
jgi:hypothetical protein